MSAVMPPELCREIGQNPALFFGPAAFAPSLIVKSKVQRDVGIAVTLMERQMRDMARKLVSCRTSEEFCALRSSIFPRYVNASVSVGSMLRSVMTNVDEIEISQEALAAIVNEFQNEGSAYLGSEGKLEVLFCLSTMKKAYGMVRFVHLREVPPESKEKDSELSWTFLVHSIFFQLNMRCLELAIHSDESVNPEILSGITEGLRASVMAYAAVREGMELRGFSSSRYADAPEVGWDEEDAALAKF